MACCGISFRSARAAPGGVCAAGLFAALFAVLSAAVSAATPAGALASRSPPHSAANAAAAAAGGGGGRQAFAQARASLLQVRTLLRGQDSQASVGSGFLVGEAGHLITNYHVVSRFALRPSQFRLTYVGADGREGALQLLDVDVVHDLALLKVADPSGLAGRRPLAFRPAAEPLQRGERIHALGNPLDVGFAVMGGLYNGLVERSFLPTIFFGGSLSAGMSGGPALDDAGRVVGINVAARRDGEQVSFLVPAAFAERLLQAARDAPPVTAPMHARIAQQLLAHQDALVDAFVGLPWQPSGHARYRLPVPQERFLRCWGSSTPADSRGLLFERSDCRMDSRVFVADRLATGYLSVRHEAYDGRRLGPLRFAERYSRSFRNEAFDAPGRQWTAPQCHERYVQRDGLPLRVLMCLRAHVRLAGLHDLSLLVATLDDSTVGAQGRFDAYGVSWEGAQRLAAHYLDGFGLVAAPAAQGAGR
jgi:S1-C subfamily serine protease